MAILILNLYCRRLCQFITDIKIFSMTFYFSPQRVSGKEKLKEFISLQGILIDSTLEWSQRIFSTSSLIKSTATGKILNIGRLNIALSFSLDPITRILKWLEQEIRKRSF